MSEFNIDDFLLNNGYGREVIRERSGKTFCRNYQKEVKENEYNCITVFPDETYSGANIYGYLFAIKKKLPTTEAEAKEILTKLEYINNESI